MIDPTFPRTLVEFEKLFGTEEKCRDYLCRMKWPEGFVCPRCGGHNGHPLQTRPVWVCQDCRHQASLIADTAFTGTRKPLRSWFLAMYLVTSSKGGISAKELKRHLGFGSYQTAWTWLHKLRAAMMDPNRKPLSGEVEVDESYLGGNEEGVRGRETEKKAIIVCAVEKRGKAAGRVRLAIVADASGSVLKEFVAGKVVAGSVTHTDGWRGYSHLERSGYQHLVHVLNGAEGKVKAHEALPWVHRVFSLLKRWIMGTHQGSASRKHLQAYLEEFTFRFNRRSAKSVTHGFQRLMEGMVRQSCKPYWWIIGRDAPKVPLLKAA